MKKTFSILIFSFLALNLVAQEFEVPKNYILKQKEDFSKYESEVLKGIDWLIQTPLNWTQPEKRKEINTVVMTWLTGSPNVTTFRRSNHEIVSFIEPDADLIMIFTL